MIRAMARQTVSVADAKKSLSRLLARVSARGESIVIERRGEPVARLVPVDRWQRGSLADVRGWLDASDPFFAEMNRIVRARHARRPRVGRARRLRS